MLVLHKRSFNADRAVRKQSRSSKRHVHVNRKKRPSRLMPRLNTMDRYSFYTAVLSLEELVHLHEKYGGFIFTQEGTQVQEYVQSSL